MSVEAVPEVESEMFAEETMKDVLYLGELMEIEYRDTFTNDSSHPYTAYTISINMSPALVDDSIPMQMTCLTLLDYALESEKEYPGTFWREVMRFLSCGDLAERLEKPVCSIFQSFLDNLFKFHDKHPLLLPSIFHYEIEMRRAADFWFKLGNLTTELHRYVYNTGISVKFDIRDESSGSSTSIDLDWK